MKAESSMTHEHYYQIRFSATSRIGKYTKNHSDRLSPHSQPDRTSHQQNSDSLISSKRKHSGCHLVSNLLQQQGVDLAKEKAQSACFGKNQ